MESCFFLGKYRSSNLSSSRVEVGLTTPPPNARWACALALPVSMCHPFGHSDWPGDGRRLKPIQWNLIPRILLEVMAKKSSLITRIARLRGFKPGAAGNHHKREPA